jgi:hypothetical protein
VARDARNARAQARGCARSHLDFESLMSQAHEALERARLFDLLALFRRREPCQAVGSGSESVYHCR